MDRQSIFAPPRDRGDGDRHGGCGEFAVLVGEAGGVSRRPFTLGRLNRFDGIYFACVFVPVSLAVSGVLYFGFGFETATIHLIRALGIDI